jgi:tumor protein p53-inducible protein 3
MNDTMRAITVTAPGGAENLRLNTVERPAAGAEEVLVRVHATALNRADILQREGKYPAPADASPLLGLEVAGEVVETGSRVARLRPGDRVCALLQGGGYAEYAVFDEGLALDLPERYSYEEGAAIPEVFLTAFQALDWIGQAREGDTVLIHAGASGVGTAAIQLAHRMGCRVVVTASGSKLDRCLELGADYAIDYRDTDFAERVKELTGGNGVSVIVDFIGQPYLRQNMQCLALDGRIVMLATMGGSRGEVDLGLLFRKRGAVVTSTLRSRDLPYRRRLVQDFSSRYMQYFSDGDLQPVIDSVFPAEQIADAHRRMEANQNVGKIVVRMAL